MDICRFVPDLAELGKCDTHVLSSQTFILIPAFPYFLDCRWKD